MVDVLLSSGVDRLLDILDPKGVPKGISKFPTNFAPDVAYFQPNEPPHAWFCRCMDIFHPGQPDACEIDDGLGVFVFLKWDRGSRLQFLSAHALKCESSLADYYTYGGEAAYLRLDYDYSTLGPIFSHPFPHVHAYPASGYRSVLEASSTGNVLVDFLDVLYRAFFHRRWLHWAEIVLSEYATRTNVPADEVNFKRVVDAFQTSQIGLLEQMAVPLARIKRVLRDYKDLTFPLRADVHHMELLRYP
jgi:hypothetical protein